jgi:hypothetical protein
MRPSSILASLLRLVHLFLPLAKPCQASWPAGPSRSSPLPSSTSKPAYRSSTPLIDRNGCIEAPLIASRRLYVSQYFSNPKFRSLTTTVVRKPRHPWPISWPLSYPPLPKLLLRLVGKLRHHHPLAHQSNSRPSIRPCCQLPRRRSLGAALLDRCLSFGRGQAAHHDHIVVGETRDETGHVESHGEGAICEPGLEGLLEGLSPMFSASVPGECYGVGCF